MDRTTTKALTGTAPWIGRVLYWPLLTASLLLSGCVSYEPAVLVPAITLSPEQVNLRAADDGAALDFGVDVSVNESDSLFNVEILPGVLVRNVIEGGPANAAGIEAGDVILEINGMTVNQPDAVRALQMQAGESNSFQFIVRRGTTVFEATVNARPIAGNLPPEQLFRADPVASRAGYRTRVVNLDGDRGMAVAEVVEIYANSPLPGAGINTGNLILAVNGAPLSSAQDLVTRLHRDYTLGESVRFSVYDGIDTSEREVKLWDPGRRISRIALGPLLQYQSSLNPPGRSFSLLDLWLFSVYNFRQVDGERSHSILGLINFTSDYGELTEEQ